ncbi:MAG: glucose-6-phosphate isomerase [Gammaproteobacteria bacterium RIFCSPHIGHO2_12_FULL_37_14]|nr:MAG: glucose-6-phosphate isomerase [Gammaproteobacteria bacterium RIFCSPHIGHO2_12_FULL_37_14]
MKNITKKKEWQLLAQHYAEIAPQHMRTWFQADPNRFTQFSIQSGNILFDYSRNRILPKTITLLAQLAEQMHLPEKIEALFTGKPINLTENRPALHTALRDSRRTPISINGENIAKLISDAQDKMRSFVNAIVTQQWRGITHQPLTYIINIGIGGSHTGPMMCTHALRPFAINNLVFHFISTIDKSLLDNILQQIDPERTLFIISSKSFTTLETLTNARTILDWMKTKFGNQVIQHHFIAITASPTKAMAWGIPEENIFPVWEWVGGRYSIWSSIGIPLMLMIGDKQFADFLQGAHEMDEHFRHTDLTKNMPVLLALLGIWYINFFGTSAQAIVPYANALRYLIPYLQQAEMESNGKRNKLNGDEIYYTTSPVIFGEEGCSGQHTYHQLLHQGPHFVPADFILIAQTTALLDHHQDILIASALSQAEALTQGKSHEEAYIELCQANYSHHEASYLAHHHTIPGNRPCNIILMEYLTPKNLGALLALYEHKIFVQGVIWEINSFDQWGVELGKQILPSILEQIQHPYDPNNASLTSQTLIDYLRKMRGAR